MKKESKKGDGERRNIGGAEENEKMMERRRTVNENMRRKETEGTKE